MADHHQIGHAVGDQGAVRGQFLLPPGGADIDEAEMGVGQRRAVAGKMLEAGEDAAPAVGGDPLCGMAADDGRVGGEAALIAADDRIVSFDIEVDHRREVEVDADSAEHLGGAGGADRRQTDIAALPQAPGRGRGRKAALGLEPADHPAFLVDGDQQPAAGAVLQLGAEPGGLGRRDDIVVRLPGGEEAVEEDHPAQGPIAQIGAEDAVREKPVALETDDQELGDLLGKVHGAVAVLSGRRNYAGLPARPAAGCQGPARIRSFRSGSSAERHGATGSAARWSPATIRCIWPGLRAIRRCSRPAG